MAMREVDPGKGGVMDYQTYIRDHYWKVVIEREAMNMDDSMDSARWDAYDDLADKDREIEQLKKENRRLLERRNRLSVVLRRALDDLNRGIWTNANEMSDLRNRIQTVLDDRD